MLSLLHRHILKEILVATGLAMGFLFVLLVGNALRDVAELVVAGKLDFWVFIKAWVCSFLCGFVCLAARNAHGAF